MRVLITDGDNRSALAATRSLGRRGHTVIVAGDRYPCLAAASRYCTAFEQHAPPVAQPESFIPFIAEVAVKHRIDVVLPMTEVTTLLLTQQRTALPPGVQLPFASAEAIARASDKAEMMRLASEVGVPIPRTVQLNSPAEIDGAIGRIGYPCVIKPGRSRVRTGTGFVSTGVSYASDEQDLRKQIAGLPSEVFPVLLQERIEGPGVGLFACFDEGRPVALFAHRRLREKPPSGGVSVLRESAPLDPDAVAHSEKLLGALRWHGVAMVEFKRDRRDGSLRLMEINGRFWGSLQLAIDAGVDFPAILVDMAGGAHPEPIRAFRLGVRTRWFWGDVDALLMMLFRSRTELNLPVHHPGRMRYLWEFMKFWGPDRHEEILRLDDPRPWLLETRRWLNV